MPALSLDRVMFPVRARLNHIQNAKSVCWLFSERASTSFGRGIRGRESTAASHDGILTRLHAFEDQYAAVQLGNNKLKAEVNSFLRKLGFLKSIRISDGSEIERLKKKLQQITDAAKEQAEEFEKIGDKISSESKEGDLKKTDEKIKFVQHRFEDRKERLEEKKRDGDKSAKKSKRQLGDKSTGVDDGEKEEGQGRGGPVGEGSSTKKPKVEYERLSVLDTLWARE